MLGAGANPSAIDLESGRSLLMTLTKSASKTVDQLESFLNDYSYIDVNAADKEGNSALIYAVYRGDVSVVALLIAHGADTSHRNKAGRTALDIAKSLSMVGKESIINMLVRFPTADSMTKAFGNLKNILVNQHLSLKDAAHALSEPNIDLSLIQAGTDGISATVSKVVSNDINKEAEELRLDYIIQSYLLIIIYSLFFSYICLYLRKKNLELSKNLEQIAAKARNEYSNNAKQRAIEEKIIKERILEAERKKKDENKGFWAKLFGF